MAKSNTRAFSDEIAARPDVDQRETFDTLWGILGGLFNKVKGRFELQPDPSTAGLQPYHANDGSGATGWLSTYAGAEIDWLVHSWVGNPRASFTNMHLTVSLASKFEAPNLGIAFGTVPDLFLYLDFVPRKDLAVNPEYMDKYYAELNEEHLRLQEDQELCNFVSRCLYMRVTQSAASLCITALDNARNLQTIRDATNRMVDQWLVNVEKSAILPESARPAQAARDELLRREIAERDPMNAHVEQMYGKQLTDELVAALWGGRRVLPRPS